MVSPPLFKSRPVHIQEQQINDAENELVVAQTKTGRRTSEDFITHFMKKRDLPPWFRGMSMCQLDAANSLLNNIRDDSEQNTTHRVREALNRLGISPIVSPKKIKLAMRLSRGNDIAFLWFLMELYYRVAFKKGDYNLNEQIVMTAIAHLDAIPTLRELNRLLPQQPEQPKAEKPKKITKKKETYLLPYFEKQTRPTSYGEDLTITETPNAANLSEYEEYMNPNYIVPNESNRWYANYQLNESKRIAKGIIDDQLNVMFSKKPVKAPQTSYCSHHDYIERVKESFLRQLAVTRRDTCRKCLDVQGGYKDKAYRRVTEDLDRRIKEAQIELQKIVQPISNTINMCMPNCTQKEEPSKMSVELTGRVSIQRSAHSRQFSYNTDDDNYDYGHADPLHNQRIYFRAPTLHTPYKFNYAQIFELGPHDLIKKTAHYCLGGCCRNITLDHGERIRQICQQLWKTSVNEYKQEYIRKKREMLKQVQPVKSGVDYGLAYYDPNDQQLMIQMLYDAIKEMRKNKKYVLATFPDAHKTPFLKEFIKKRYGFVYTRSSKRKDFKMSKEVFDVLNRTQIRVRIPATDDVAKNRIVSYACNKFIQDKTNYLKERYNHNFKTALMGLARNYWGAVRPYQCSNGPPRREFFAYLPSRENDIHTFRPWKVNEYIKAKEEWDKRQKMKRNKLFG